MNKAVTKFITRVVVVIYLCYLATQLFISNINNYGKNTSPLFYIVSVVLALAAIAFLIYSFKNLMRELGTKEDLMKENS